MSAPQIDGAKQRAIREAFARLGSKTAVARELGLDRNTVRKYLDPTEVAGPTDAAPVEAPTASRTEAGDAARIEYTSDQPIRTLDDAIQHGDVDLAVWYVDRWECGSYEVTLKLSPGKGEPDVPVRKTMWRVRLYLKRILPKPILDATEAVFARMRDHAPKYEMPRAVAPPKDPHLMVLDLVDVHFGKLAWRRETGEDYDLRIAEKVYREAVAELLRLASGFEVDEFLIPLGSDFLHIDGLEPKTTSGTPMDSDGRWAKIIETAEMAVIHAVEELSRRARVSVRYVPGNHDRLLSYCLARTVSAWFRNHPGVAVDIEPTTRKYHRYHGTLIGLTHGDEERHTALPALMATEAPEAWAATLCREWHIGHKHQSKRLDYLALDTHGGVPVRTLKSLSAVDAWHYRRGYVGSRRAAEAYVYDRCGLVGFFCANVRS